MVAYRLYCLDRDGGISPAEWIEAPDDASAIERARELKPHALKCEIWRDKRLIATLDAKDSAAETQRLAAAALSTSRHRGSEQQLLSILDSASEPSVACRLAPIPRTIWPRGNGPAITHRAIGHLRS
jgi:hypothetical protein